jgi:hypothetical protein
VSGLEWLAAISTGIGALWSLLSLVKRKSTIIKGPRYPGQGITELPVETDHYRRFPYEDQVNRKDL